MIQITKFPTGSSGRIIYFEGVVEDGNTLSATEAQAQVDAGTAEFADYDFRPKARLWVLKDMGVRFAQAVDADLEFPADSGVIFNGDPNSRILIDAEVGRNMVKASRGEEVAPVWFAKNDAPISMTAAELEDLGLALRDRYKAAVVNSVAHSDALEAEEDIEAIKNYDFSAGWPA